ncbi:hypothetical protein FRC20_007344, partial [Serendipita sp. 405]
AAEDGQHTGHTNDLSLREDLCRQAEATIPDLEPHVTLYNATLRPAYNPIISSLQATFR